MLLSNMFGIFMLLAAHASEVGDCCSGHLGTIDGCDQCPYGYEPNTGFTGCFWLSLIPFSDWCWSCRPLLDDIDQTALEDLMITTRFLEVSNYKFYYVRDGANREEWEAEVEALANLGYFVETPITSSNFVQYEGDTPQVIQWYVGIHGGQRQLVIVYHGSSTLEDWTETNIPAALDVEGEKCLDINGNQMCGPQPVVEDYELTRDAMKEAIFSILDVTCNEDCISVVRVIGHSLRGAAASYLALEIAERYGSKYTIWLSSAASIKPLTEDSSDWAQEVMSNNGNRHYRFTINGDLVPRFPNEEYKHFGQAIFVDDGHPMTKDRDHVPDDHDAEECWPLGAAKCFVNHHTTNEYLKGALLAKEYYYALDSIPYRGPEKDCECSGARRKL